MTDLDEEIVRRAGKPIHRIFSEDGEIVFRAMERHAALTLCEGGDKVIAAGGGAFAQELTRQVLLENGVVFCLTAQRRNHPPSHHPGQPQRRRAAHAWPAATRWNASARCWPSAPPAYAQAHHVVATDDRTPEEVADEVLQNL